MTRRHDGGMVLPLVLVVVVVLGAVIAAVATYASTTLRYGQVVESSSDRLAAANAAMDNALEAIDRSASPCTLTTLANSGYEYDMLLPSAPISTINGVNPRVRCETSGADVTGIEEFALVITGDPGDGFRTDALLTVGGSAVPRKVIDGPVFMAQRPNVSDSLDLNAPLTINGGDLWYGNPTCPAIGVSAPASDLLISPAGYGIRCIETADWESLFASARPSESAVVGMADATLPAPPVPGQCTVFEPGRYTSPPILGTYNYFRSGDYYFEDIGNWTLSNRYVLFGWPGPSGPGVPGWGNDTLANNACVGAWESDPDQSGATVYLGGDSRITIGANGALEISGRNQPFDPFDPTSGQRVGLHALEDEGVRSTIHGDDVDGPGPLPAGSRRLIDIKAGSNKQILIEGLVWAPYASIEFNNVSNDAVAALTGGAVVGEIFLQAPASATNLLVTSGQTPDERRLEITATATNSGTTQVRSVIEYRDGDYALVSRRVVDITPE